MPTYRFTPPTTLDELLPTVVVRPSTRVVEDRLPHAPPSDLPSALMDEPMVMLAEEKAVLKACLSPSAQCFT